jgi:hypothetical protein
MVRMSVTSPSAAYKKNKQLYYLSMKKRMLNFVQTA